MAIWSGGGAETATPLDPQNPGPEGAHGLARVLDDQGVDVEIARRHADLDEVGVDDDPTVVVTSTEHLGQASSSGCATTSATPAWSWSSPARKCWRRWSTTSTPAARWSTTTRTANCADPLMDGLRSRSTGRRPSTPGCFTDDGRSVLVERGTTMVLGAGEALTNDQVLRGDNAAVALRLLGQSDRLVWYVPSSTTSSADDGVSAQTLLPRWIRPGALAAAIIGLS